MYNEVDRQKERTYDTPLGSTTNSVGPVLSTAPRIVLQPNGRTEEYRVYACTYNPTLSTTYCMAMSNTSNTQSRDALTWSVGAAR